MSLQARLMGAALLVLLLFTLLTGLALERAFRQSAEAAMQDRMEGYLFALLAAVDMDESGDLYFSRPLPDPRFAQPDSGLYARVWRADGRSDLHSASLLGHALDWTVAVRAGQQRFRRLWLDGRQHFLLAYGANWEQADGRTVPLYFTVVEDSAPYDRQTGQYRRTLWSWLGSAAVLLLLAQWLVLRWGLRPLRRIRAELANIESGRADALQGRYPRELQQLAAKINDLLASSRQQLQRYRDSLGNMAHSLKTPLAILTNLTGKGADDAEARQQLQRIRQIIDYQLQHATTAGRAASGGRLALAPLLQRIIDAMHKVHGDKPVETELALAVAGCRCDEGDAMEMLGNLIENAFKWCRGRIRIRSQRTGDGHLRLCVEDDGPGIAEDRRQQVLQRGQRLDSAVEGHGLGLAMVREIVLLYGGELSIGHSELGGAAVCLTLPASG